MTTMRETFGVPVGLSDHSEDPLVGPLAAVAVGAALLEKHFTFCHELPGPDHRFALEPEGLRLMIRKVRELEQVLGSGDKRTHTIETELRGFARRSIFAVQPIPAGTPLTTENVAVLRCGKQSPGLAPREFPRILGRTVAKPIQAGTAVQPDDLAPTAPAEC
jgi:sialic acid synthase SpsE